MLFLSHDKIAVRTQNDEQETAAICYDGTVHVITSITDNGDGTISWTGRNIRFVHGLYAPDPNAND